MQRVFFGKHCTCTHNLICELNQSHSENKKKNNCYCFEITCGTKICSQIFLKPKKKYKKNTYQWKKCAIIIDKSEIMKNNFIYALPFFTQKFKGAKTDFLLRFDKECWHLCQSANFAQIFIRVCSVAIKDSVNMLPYMNIMDICRKQFCLKKYQIFEAR